MSFVTAQPEALMSRLRVTAPAITIRPIDDF